MTALTISTRVAPAAMEMVKCEAETSVATRPTAICAAG